RLGIERQHLGHGLAQVGLAGAERQARDRGAAGASAHPGAEELEPEAVGFGNEGAHPAERRAAPREHRGGGESGETGHPSAPASLSRAMSSQPKPASSSTSSVCWPSSGAGPATAEGVAPKATGPFTMRRGRPAGSAVSAKAPTASACASWLTSSTVCTLPQ